VKFRVSILFVMLMFGVEDLVFVIWVLGALRGSGGDRCYTSSFVVDLFDSDEENKTEYELEKQETEKYSLILRLNRIISMLAGNPFIGKPN
jgi:hypothetical protein